MTPIDALSVELLNLIFHAVLDLVISSPHDIGGPLYLDALLKLRTVNHRWLAIIDNDSAFWVTLDGHIPEHWIEHAAKMSKSRPLVVRCLEDGAGPLPSATTIANIANEWTFDTNRLHSIYIVATNINALQPWFPILAQARLRSLRHVMLDLESSSDEIIHAAPMRIKNIGSLKSFQVMGLSIPWDAFATAFAEIRRMALRKLTFVHASSNDNPLPVSFSNIHTVLAACPHLRELELEIDSVVGIPTRRAPDPIELHNLKHITLALEFSAAKALLTSILSEDHLILDLHLAGVPSTNGVLELDYVDAFGAGRVELCLKGDATGPGAPPDIRWRCMSVKITPEDLTINRQSNEQLKCSQNSSLVLESLELGPNWFLPWIRTISSISRGHLLYMDIDEGVDMQEAVCDVMRVMLSLPHLELCRIQGGPGLMAPIVAALAYPIEPTGVIGYAGYLCPRLQVLELGERNQDGQVLDVAPTVAERAIAQLWYHRQGMSRQNQVLPLLWLSFQPPEPLHLIRLGRTVWPLPAVSFNMWPFSTSLE
jgi:hypothetical protein